MEQTRGSCSDRDFVNINNIIIERTGTNISAMTEYDDYKQEMKQSSDNLRELYAFNIKR